MLQGQFAPQMWAARPHLANIFEKLLDQKTFGCLRLVLGKPLAYGSARLGHILSLPWESQLPLKPCILIAASRLKRQLRFFRFTLRFLFSFIVQFCYLLRKCGLLAHTSPTFLKNCWIKKLFIACGSFFAAISSHYQINLPLWMRLQKEDEIQPMLNQLKNRYRQWQYRRICRTLQLPPQLIQDLPTLANQTQQSGAAVQQLQTTMQQTLSRLQQDDLTTLSLLERVTKLERAASSQGSHNMDLNMLMKTTYSQSGEDAILAYLFAVLGIPFAKCTYLDLGANRPKEMSNTYFFYEQGATGTLIEANPALIPALQKERSGDVILNRCIAPKSGDVIPFHVMNVDGLSTPEDVTELLANHPDLKLLETVNVETVSVNDLFAQMHAVPVLVNIDIEGMEMEILRSIDFTKYRPLVLILEMIPYSKKLPVGQKNPEILAFLQEKGYVEYAFTGINSIFIDAAQVK